MSQQAMVMLIKEINHQLSSDQNLVYLLYFKGFLPSYIGIKIYRYKDPY